MARKSNQQKQRLINLRGRVVSTEYREDMADAGMNSEIETPVTHVECAGVMDATPGKMKSINALTGIPELEVETDEDEEETTETNPETSQPKQSTMEKETEATTGDDDLLQLQIEDVEEEIEYWSQAVVCFILEANPPWEIIEGFIRRIWAKYSIDKVSFMPNGVFLVRFKTKEMQEQVLKSGYHLFDNKPLIYQPWTKELELKKTNIEIVPAWIQFHNLPLKFWGKSLPKITGIIGKYIKSDIATTDKTKVGYARVMVELKMNQNMPDKVSFKDENGELVQVEVEYEWKPVTCNNCKGLGHLTDQCRKNIPPKAQKQTVKRVWRPVSKIGMEGKKFNEAKTAEVNRTDPTTQHTTESREAYSSNAFGSISYRDAVSPPQKQKESVQTVNDTQQNQVHG
ncbi:hypothetical protein vseg_001010 [Gypsophila vaccaria]